MISRREVENQATAVLKFRTLVTKFTTAVLKISRAVADPRTRVDYPVTGVLACETSVPIFTTARMLPGSAVIKSETGVINLIGKHPCWREFSTFVVIPTSVLKFPNSLPRKEKVRRHGRPGREKQTTANPRE